MAKAKMTERVVAHPKRYMRVNGKLQRVEVGSVIEIEEDRAKKLKAQLADPAAKMRVANGKLVPDDNKSDNGKLKAAEDRAASAEAELAKAQEEKAELEHMLAESTK